jgi:fructose transport system permease protein
MTAAAGAVLRRAGWEAFLALAALATLAYAVIFVPNFATAFNLSQAAAGVSEKALLALPLVLLIIAREIDLSVASILALASVVLGVLVQAGFPLPVAMAAALATGAAAGALNGLLVTRVKLPPFIVTLGTLSIFTAIALLYTKGRLILAADMPDLLNWTGTRIPLGPFNVTTGVLIVLAIYLVVGFALSQTAWGRHVYSVGDDAEASRLAGISTQRVLFSVYLVAGVVYGIAAWALIGRSGGADPNAIGQANLESITAVVIGGTSLFGGRGGVLGTLLGALIVQSFALGLSLAGVDDQYRILAVGILVIAAVSVDQWIRQVKA